MELSNIIPFGAWEPDKADWNTVGATVCKNVVSAGSGYEPIKSLQAKTSALPSKCKGMFSGKQQNGTVITSAATDSALYLRNGASWNEVSKTGGYNTTSEETWKYVLYGNMLIATNYSDPIQVMDLSSDTQFSNLEATGLRARHIAIVNNFVVVANTYDSVDGEKPQRVRWSGIDNPTWWEVSAAKQSDLQDIQGHGEINGIVGSENSAIIVLENAIARMEYYGTPYVFTINTVEENRGSKISGSIVGYAGAVFYRGEDGFYMFNSAQSVPIGDDVIDKFWETDVDNNNLHNVRSAINPRNKVVMWAYPSIASDGTCDKILFYNWVTKRWSVAEVKTQEIGRILSEGVNLDDAEWEDLSIDDNEASVDSSQYSGGTASIGAFDGENKLATFSGGNLDAEIETGEARLNTSGRAYVSSVYPMVDCSEITLEVGSRNKLTEQVAYSQPVSVSDDTGEAYSGVDARYHRVRVKMHGEWTKATGVQFASRRTGRR